MADPTVERRLRRRAAWRAWLGAAILTASIINGVAGQVLWPERLHLTRATDQPYYQPAPQPAPQSPTTGGMP
jgi:hypothetical protein